MLFSYLLILWVVTNELYIYYFSDNRDVCLIKVIV